MSEFLVVIEKSDGNYSAYLPDLPGCVATGDTREGTLDLLREALAMHIEGLKEEGVPIPSPSSSASYVAV